MADVFEMPLREALTLSRYYPLDIHRAGHTHRIYLSVPRPVYLGLTAAIIRRPLSRSVFNPHCVI